MIGVGTAVQRVEEPGGGDDVVALMTAAARQAVDDAGVAGAVDVIGRISVPYGGWSLGDPGAEIGRRIGCGAIGRTLLEVGIPQQALFNDAYERIGRGEVEGVLVVGGEAAHRTTLAQRSGVVLDDPTCDGRPDDRRSPNHAEIVTEAELAAGLWDPVAVYALIDDAIRTDAGQTPGQRRTEVAELWAGFNAVATANPEAAFPTPRTADWLREPSEANRVISFPYNKWHCSQINVDQAGAVLVTSLATARRLGVDPDRIVAPVVALQSNSAVPAAARRQLGRWIAMGVLGDAAVAHLGHPLAEIPHLDLYSCFPAAVTVQQQALGLPAAVAPTVTGGMAFAGGPWNNYVLQSTPAVVRRVREDGRDGLVTSVSGFVHKPGLAVFSTDPAAPDLLVDDLGPAAAAATEVAPTATDHEGPVTVVAATVRHGAGFDRRAYVIADTPDGTRVVASSGRPGLLDAIESEGIVGEELRLEGGRLRS